MAKLLQTNLPLALNDDLSADLYNRLIRILEINLGEFDPSNTDQSSTLERNVISFNPGSIIFNTDLEKLQVWSGTAWYNIDMQLEEEKNFLMVSSLGKVTVTNVNNGDISINL